ncbi:MAG: response regulator, partial [Candidatus Accumulibacter sp.]|nr:response regulator [Accumulibacter sp.]
MTPINTETPSPPPATKPLLLLVDDIPSNLHVLAAALRADYRIKTATNGRTALGLAKHSDPPDLILLDVMMPEMSGIDVLRHLRQSPDTAGIPVIFVSADVSEETQLQGLDLGADDYLSKPVIASLLRVRIRNLLQRKRDEARLRLAAHVFRCCGEAILVADRDNRIIDVNPAFTRISGYTLDDVRGHETGFFLAPRPTLAKDFRQLLALSSNPEVAKQEVLLLSKDGTL